MSNGFAAGDGETQRHSFPTTDLGRGPGEARSDREPLTMAASIAAILATTAAVRDERGGTPKEERDILRRSGLLGMVVPTELGGLGAGWADTMRVVRILSRADSAVGHVFGFHHLLLATARLFGKREQWAPLFADTVKNSWFWGNALNPLDTRTTISQRDGAWVLNGQKSFCSGARDSDRLIVSAVPAGGGRLVVAAIPTAREGVHLRDDWDNIGQKQTDSGGADFADVVVTSDEILDTPGPLGSTFASLRPCIAQLVLANVYLGIAEGALAEARRYTREHSRPWSASGVTKAADDPYVLLRYGKLGVDLQGAALLTERAGTLLDDAWNRGDELTPRTRGECSLAIASAKVSTTEVGLEVTTRMFDVMGARATSGKARLDRYWRNLRTHTLHDPVDYKLRDIGNFLLNDEIPVPSFYG